jgi:VCBS repeat-containing protein
LNYAGWLDAKVSAGGSGSQRNGLAPVDTIAPHPTHAPADALVVPDADLLFNGEFRRAGVDLVLSRDGREIVLHDYFKGEKRAALASPDGAHLSGDVIDALTGHTQYAQAGGGSGSTGGVIGHVTKLTGTATMIRNGVSIILHLGDNVEKGDVVQSGSDSTLGITFIDGTVFGLSSNARMVLNEMIYDPNGSTNSSLLSLVAGTISFVAGQTAKRGDMKVDTPVATMGIRGTAVLAEIDFSVPGQGGLPAAHFQVLVEPDGTTGSYTLFDRTTLLPIATVNQAGQQINISQGQLSITNAPLSPDEQRLITDVFTLKFTDNNNPNPKTITAQNDSITPQTLNPIKLADGATATPIVIHVSPVQPSVTTGPAPVSGTHPIDTTINITPRINLPPSVVAVSAQLAQAGVTGPGAIANVSNKINFVDPNAGDTPTVSIQFSSFSYQNAAHQDVSGSLTKLQQSDIAALEVSLVVVPAPGNSNNGSANWTYSVPGSALGFLAAGETLTLTYLASVDNNYAPNPQQATTPFTITLTGSNAAPVITSAAQSAALTALAGAQNAPTLDMASGAITFTDANLSDTHTVAVSGVTASGVTSGLNPTAALAWLTLTQQSDSGNGATGTDVWTFSAASRDFDYLNAGEQLILTYTVQVKDGHGGIVTTPVTITVTGTGPTEPFVWASEVSGSWTDPTSWNNAGFVPGAHDQARITYSDILVTVSSTEAVDTLASAATLDITSDGALTIADASGNSSNSGVIDIYGTLTLDGGTLDSDPSGDQAGSIVVENGGTLTVKAAAITGATLRIANASEASGFHGDVVVNTPSAATLLLEDGAAIAGGTLTINAGGKLDIEFGASGSGATLDGVILYNSGIVEVDAAVASTGMLRLEDGTIISGGTLTIGDGATLAIGSGANDLGATLDGVGVGNSGRIEIDARDQDPTLILEAGTIISGGTLAIGSGDALDIGPGTINGPGAELDGVTVTAADLTSTIVVASDSTLTLNGASITGATINFAGVPGDIDIHGSSTINGGASLNGGYVSIENGQTLTLDDVTVTGATFNFFGSGDTLKLSQPSSFNGTVAGLANGDAIDLTSLGYSPDDYAQWTQTATADGGAGTLQVYDKSGVLQASFHLNGIYAQGDFVLADDQTSSHGTDVNIVDVNINHVSFYGGTINSNGVYTPQISQGGSTLQLTDGANGEAASWFANTPYSVTSFTLSFDYHATVGSNPADGLALILQNSAGGVDALGSGGGDLGYGGITPSAAVEFNLYAPYGRGTAFETDGLTGIAGSIYQSTGDVAFWNGDAMHVVVSYHGSVLTEALTDLVNGATYVAAYAGVDLASILRGSTAIIGFSAGTGADVSTQTVSNFTFTNANFNFVSDGHEINGVAGSSGTMVGDPPVPPSSPGQAAASHVSEMFVFAPTTSGPAVQRSITGFVDGIDKIDLRQFSNISASALPAAIQQGSDTVLTLDNHDTLWLKNFVASHLHAGDFMLHA